MDTSPEDIVNTIYKYKHHLEFKNVINQLNIMSHDNGFPSYSCTILEIESIERQIIKHYTRKNYIELTETWNKSGVGITEFNIWSLTVKHSGLRDYFSYQLCLDSYPDYHEYNEHVY